MFPSSDMNFDQGRFLQPSNNTAAQSLFQRNDPFAQNIPGVNGEASPAGVSSVLDVAMAQQGGAVVGEPTQFDPVAQGPQLNFAPPDRRDAPGFGSRAEGANAQLVKPVAPVDILTNPIGAEAQKLGAVFLNNPFISPKGRQALREGRVPQMNDLQPAFFRFTSPDNVQALQALIRRADSAGGTGPTQSTQEFFANVFANPTL